MSFNGKTDGFNEVDLIAFGTFADLKPHEVKKLLAQINLAKERWREFCDIAGVAEEVCASTARGFRDFNL